jgi:hypothetical protein
LTITAILLLQVSQAHNFYKMEYVDAPLGLPR